MIKVAEIANQINEEIESFHYFWACGLIRETNLLWEKEENKKLLNPIAQMLAKHYATKAKERRQL